MRLPVVRPTRLAKPPYRVPTVAEAAAVPRNGLTVASTFTGAGGSCLGWETAGYRVAWANEVVPAARDTYLANRPGAVVDPRDIRQVQPEDVLAATDLAVGELDVLEGSPPCQPFSTAGRREKGWGRVTAHADGTAQVSDDLFFEYARLLESLRPRAFAAENVSGLVKGTAKGYFLEIMARLGACGYRIRARVLDAQWLGVPQHRERLFIVGVRDDLGLEPAFPDPLPYRYSVRDALPGLTGGRMAMEPHGWFGGRTVDLDREPSPTVMAGGMPAAYAVDLRLPPSRARALDGGRAFNFRRADPDEPAPTVTISSPGNDTAHPTERRKFTIAELRRICGFPDDYVLTGPYDAQWARLGNSVPPPMAAAVARALEPVLLAARDRTSAAT